METNICFFLLLSSSPKAKDPLFQQHSQARGSADHSLEFHTVWLGTRRHQEEVASPQCSLVASPRRNLKGLLLRLWPMSVRQTVGHRLPPWGLKIQCRSRHLIYNTPGSGRALLGQVTRGVFKKAE